MEKKRSISKKKAFRQAQGKPEGWAWDLPRADEPQLAISFYEHLQLRLPKRSFVVSK